MAVEASNDTVTYTGSAGARREAQGVVILAGGGGGGGGGTSDATAANQAIEIARLTSLRDATGAPADAVYASSDGSSAGTVLALLKGVYVRASGIGTAADTAATSDAGTFSLISLFKRSLGFLSNISSSYTSIGTAAPTMASQIAGVDAGNITRIPFVASNGTMRVGTGGGNWSIGDGYALNTMGAFLDQSGSSANRVWAQLPMYYNGATLDRARGDTSGMFIGAGQFFTESATGLAASATLNGTLRTNGGIAGGVGSRFSSFIAEAFSDVAGGTLYIDKTVDGGTTYRQVGSIALAAGTSVSLKLPISAAGYRARVVNGATAQGAALVTSAYSLN